MSVERFVNRLLRGRRTPRFRARPEDAALLRTAIELRAARPGADAPREEFVTALHRRLAAEQDPGPGRRRVVQIAGVAAATAAVGAAAAHTVDGLVAADPEPAPELVPTKGSWQAVAADLPEGEVRAFSAGGVTGFVRRDAGRLDAVSGICTHQGCRLRLDQDLLRCPCHDTTFRLDGSLDTHALRTAPAALPHLEVREAGGRVEVFAPEDEPGPRA